MIVEQSSAEVNSIPAVFPLKRHGDALHFSTEAFVGSLQSMEYALAQEGKSSLAIHLSLDQLQFRHLALHLSVVDRPS